MGDVMGKPNVLFITLNRHQRNYFRLLGEALSHEYNVFHLPYPMVEPLAMIKRPSIPDEFLLTEAEIEEVIGFLVLKGQYRRFGLVRKWLHSPAYLRSKADAAMRYMYWYMINHQIDMVCVWNGTLVPLAVAVTIARKLGKKTMFFENGTLPGTTTVDPVGVNNRSILVGKDASFYDKVIVDPVKMDAIRNSKPGIRALKTRWYNQVFRKKPSTPENIHLPSRFIFVPFQVQDDTQVLWHSPRIKTMFALVDCVMNAVTEYNRQSGDDLWVIFKEHPSDYGRIDYSPIKEKYQGQKVYFLKYFPTPELIDKSMAVITINSSVGIEALVQHKPVITLGNAYYNIDGVVKHVQQVDSLPDVLAALPNIQKVELVDNFLYYLRYCYLVPGSWRQPDEEHFSQVSERFHEVLLNTGQWGVRFV
jgi:capsular polysaccharide export protein